MINQQLIDFIKKQSQGGLTRAKISSDLLANGWSAQDIEDGFKAANVPIPSTAPMVEIKKLESHHIVRKIFFILLVLVLLGGGASAYYYKDTLVKIPVIENILVSMNIQLPQTDVVQEVPQVPQVAPQPKVETQGVIPQPVAVNTEPSISTYTDLSSLYSFNYPSNEKIIEKTNSTVSLSIDKDSNPVAVIMVALDINSKFLTELKKAAKYQKSSYGNIGIYPTDKYVATIKNKTSTVYNSAYVINLGTYNNTNLSILFNVTANVNDQLINSQIEENVKSITINKEKIITVIENLLAEKNSTAVVAQKPVITTPITQKPAVTTPVVEKPVTTTPAVAPVVAPAKTVQTTVLTDTQIEKILKNTRLEAEVYYWNSESYAGFCKSSDYTSLVKSVKQADLNCKDSKDTYAISSVISDGYWCVDNTGYDDKSSLNTGTVCIK